MKGRFAIEAPRISLIIINQFINALVAGLVEQHGVKVLQKTVFKGCNPPIQVLIEAAVDLGASKINGRINA